MKRCDVQAMNHRAYRSTGLAFLAAALAAGCTEADPVDPGPNFRFGQVGEIRIQIVTPLPGARGLDGELQQALTWNSEGSWQVFESISYRGLVGDASVEQGFGDPGSYADVILQLNETPGLELFVEELDPNLDPVCEGADARIVLQIRDNLRGEEARWIRCSGETLERLTETEAGPDVAAARVITVARRTRDFTLTTEWRSNYSGSIAFGTLDRGEASQSAMEEPRAFLGTPLGDGTAMPPQDWATFWAEHRGSTAPPPEIDWSEDMVLVGTVGLRQEAGDSVEIRRILQLESETVVELRERVPGDFCSPAAQVHTPFHIVLAPRTRPVHRFEDAVVERVPCGA